MEFDAVLLPGRRAESMAKGYWHDRTINDYLQECVAKHPDKLALTAISLDTNGTRRFTYREMAKMADRIAVGLSRLGVGKGDVVAMQLPNWWQFSLLYLACSRIGAVLNPMMHIFRERELKFMVNHAEAKVLVVPKTFRGFDYEGMAMNLKPELPSVQHVIVVGSHARHGFDALLTDPEWENEPDAAAILSQHRPGPDDVTQILYTSGTTGEPKGVQHSANTLVSNIIPYAERMHLGADDVVLMASPMAHQTGFLYGLVMPIVLQAHVVLQDIWETKQAIEIINREKVSFTMASTPFLTDLTRTVTEAGQSVPTLKTFVCAGAPIPGPLVEQARNGLGTKIISAWGMTETGAVTTTSPEDDDALSVNTDGRPLRGVEVKVVDFDGKELPAGEIGQLLVRCCSNFGGYLKRPHLNATDADGWFDTGDMARMDENGYIRISGRSKDVIIRGGENIPVFEVESLLYKHPAVAQVAIVSYSDERMGERACAVVVPKEGAQFDMEAMGQFLREQRVAPQYMPERLVIVASMPATPSGKVQKFRLRDMLRDGII